MRNLFKEKIVYIVDTDELYSLMYEMLLLLCERNGNDITETGLGITINIIDQKVTIEYQTDMFSDVEYINIPQSEDDIGNFMSRIRDLVSEIFDCM